jgi:hypothetical protein
MKHVLIFLAFFSALSISHAQLELGVKAGLSSYSLAKDLKAYSPISNPNVQIQVADADYGHHFGVYTRLKLWAIYLEPAVLFNSNKVTYKIDDYAEGDLISSLRTEKYNYVDVPVMLGIKMGPIRLQGGVAGHLHINSISDVVDVDEYQQKFERGTYSWQAGVGADVWKLRVDLNIEGNLSGFGDKITVDGTEYTFGNRPHRLVASLGYKF